MVGVESSSRFRLLSFLRLRRRWRSGLLTGSVLVVLMALYQNCGRMKSSVPNPAQVYRPEILRMLAGLPEAQKASLCQSAANYQCQRLRVGDHLLDRDLAEMVCLKHEAFPKRVCIQTQFYDRSIMDPAIACQGCSAGTVGEPRLKSVEKAGARGPTSGGDESSGRGSGAGSGGSVGSGAGGAGSGDGVEAPTELSEYSCYNSALKVRTLVEHRVFASSLEEALSQAFYSCRASVSHGSEEAKSER
ncbi:MAG: hypothetical protein IT288_03675 [Bdellovibrionales bacterium]|nr:hypothetical protein [Bdellovibrionales bacterium]